jgi:hypothetical protein
MDAFISEEDILGGIVSDEQIAAMMNQQRNNNIFTAFERVLEGTDNTIELPFPEDKAGIDERANEILEEARKEVEEKPVPLEPMTGPEKEEAYAELEEISKVLESRDISPEVRFRLGNRAMSLRNAVSLPTVEEQAEVSPEGETAQEQEPTPAAAPAAEVAKPEAVEQPVVEPVVEPEIDPKVQTEIEARTSEIEMIQDALKKGPSQQARRILETRLKGAQDELYALKNPEVAATPETVAPEEPQGFESALQTKEQVQQVLEKLDEALAEYTETDNPEMVRQLQDAIGRYTQLQEDLPSEKELDPDLRKKLKADFKNIVGKEVVAEQVLEKTESIGAVKITDQAETPLEESQRVVDLPSRVVAWTQDMTVTTGERTASIVAGYPKGSDIVYYLIRGVEEKGTWIVMKKVPGERGTVIGAFSQAQAKQEGTDARKMAAEFAINNFRELGSDQWLPDVDANGKNTWAINVPGGDTQLVLTQVGKNKWSVEEDGNVVQRELDSGKLTDLWSSMSIGQVKNAVEELYGFGTTDTAADMYSEILASRNVPSKMGQVMDSMKDASVGQMPPSRKPKPKALSTRDFYTLYEPVLTPEQSASMGRAVIGPRTAKRTADYNYIGMTMTDELRDTIRENITRLRDEQASSSARFGDTSQEAKAIIAGIEDSIGALTRISLIKNGEKIRIKTGVDSKGRVVYAKAPRIKPRRELTEKEKAKGFRTSGKARADRALKEAGGKPKSKAQQKRETLAQAERFAASQAGSPGEVIPVDERVAGIPEVEGEVTRVPQPVTPQPIEAKPDEIVRTEPGPPEIASQSAKIRREEAVEEATAKYINERDKFVNIMLGRVEAGKDRALTPDELRYYTAINQDLYEKNNPLQEVAIFQDFGPTEVEEVVETIRNTEPSPRAKARKTKFKTARVRKKQSRLRSGYIQEYGTPKEKNAWQLLESTSDEPLVRALKSILSEEELSKIEVIHDPLETTSYYDPKYDFIVLKGNNPYSKVHEVIHAALFYRLRRSPSLIKEVDALMERFRKKAVDMGVIDYPTVAYALKNRDEFLAQAGADPVVQMVMETDPKAGKFKNAWEAFVDWARKVLGLPQKFRRELGEALSVMGKISQRQRIKQAKFLSERNITIPAAPEINETPEQRRERIREIQRVAREDKGTTFWGSQLKFAKDLAAEAGKYVRPITDVLTGIHKSLPAMLRMAEAKYSRSNKQQMEQVTPLGKMIKDLSDDDLSDFKSGWLNPDERQLMEDVIDRNGMREEWNRFKALVKAKEKELLKLGVISRKQIKKDYLPRIVADPLGLANAFEGRPEWTAFDQQLRKERIRIDKIHGAGTFDRQAEEEYVAKMLMNRRYNIVPLKFFEKNRIIDHVPANMLQYYADPVETIVQYIHETNDLIFSRSLAGRSNRNVLLSDLSNLQDRLERLKSPEKIELVQRQIAEIEADIMDIDTDTTMALDKLLLDLPITSEQRTTAMNAINARLSQSGTRGAVRKLKDLTLMMTIGNPLSAITQLGDQGFNIFDNGAYGVGGIFKAIGGKDRVVDEFDLENALREFAQDPREGGTAKLLDKILSISGLKQMDIFGKESYFQGMMGSIQGGNYESYLERFDVYGEFLEGEESADWKLQEAYDSIVEGKPNENAIYMLHSELAKRQPVSLSEMPQKFLTAGNGRIFYVLKSFAIRAVNSAFTAGFEKWNGGQRVAGIAQVVGLLTVLGLAGAGTDMIKDLILGRDLESLPDAVIANIMNLLFINRYSLERGLDMKKPISEIVANNIMLPPVRALDSIVTDAISSAQGDFSYRTMAYLPVVGRIAFDYTPLGREAEGKRMRQSILDLAEKGASQGKLSGLVRDFNSTYADGQVDGLEPITSSTIRSARTRK